MDQTFEIVIAAHLVELLIRPDKQPDIASLKEVQHAKEHSGTCATIAGTDHTSPHHSSVGSMPSKFLGEILHHNHTV